jgi:hypothetical protein
VFSEFAKTMRAKCRQLEDDVKLHRPRLAKDTSVHELARSIEHLGDSNRGVDPEFLEEPSRRHRCIS